MKESWAMFMCVYVQLERNGLGVWGKRVKEKKIDERIEVLIEICYAFAPGNTE